MSVLRVKIFVSFVLFLLVLSRGNSTDFTFPEYKRSVKSIQECIPNGWMVLDSAKGDLNNDKHSDIAVVIQCKDTVEFDNDESHIIPDSCQPRILLLMLYNSATKQYDLVENSETFILCHDNPNMSDPFQEITIMNGLLNITFEIFMYAGSWTMSNHIYKFRYSNKKFVLIGAENSSTHRATGETEHQVYNFSTGKIKITKGNVATERQKIEWRKMIKRDLKTLASIIRPFQWEVSKGLFL